MRYTREEIKKALNEKVEQNKPVIAANIGYGLSAKVADRTGVDLILIYSGGLYRADGAAACGAELAYMNCNDATWNAGVRIIDKIENTPVIGGVGVADPYRDIQRFVDELLDYGFSGVMNAPSTAGWEGNFNAKTAFDLLGYPAEIKFIEACSKRDIFTFANCALPSQGKAMGAAGADVICIDLGATIGGMLPFEGTETKEAAAERVTVIYDEIKRENGKAIAVFHGGPFAEPEDIKWGLGEMGVQGYAGGSAIERIPVERAIAGVISELKVSL